LIPIPNYYNYTSQINNREYCSIHLRSSQTSAPIAQIIERLFQLGASTPGCRPARSPLFEQHKIIEVLRLFHGAEPVRLNAVGQLMSEDVMFDYPLLCGS